MDELKLAFETIIVGLLAIPWVLILFHLAFCIIARRSLLTKVGAFLTDSHQSFALVGPILIGLAYCGGTILFPLADQYFNDPHFLPYVKGDDRIRVDTLTKVYFDRKHKYYDLSTRDFAGMANAERVIKVIKTRGPDALKPGNRNLEYVSKEDYENLESAIHALYNYQKFQDYNSVNGYEVLKPLHSRIVVLRGAVLNGLLLEGALLLFFYVALLDAVLRIHRRFGLLLVGILVALLCMGIIVWKSFHWWGAWQLPTALLCLAAVLLLFFAALSKVFSWSKEGASRVDSHAPSTKKPLRLVADPATGERGLGLLILLMVGGLVWLLCWWGAWGVVQAEDEYDKHVVGIFYSQKSGASTEKASEPGDNKTTEVNGSNTPPSQIKVTIDGPPYQPPRADISLGDGAASAD